MALAVDYADIQGIVRFGYARMTEASYYLVKVRDAHIARSWLARAPVTSAVKLDQPPKTALQVAFTRQGLETLGLPPSVMAGFPLEFLAGMAEDEDRSRRLGDTGQNSPAFWRWGSAGRIPDAVVMLFGEPGLLPAWKQSVKGQFWETGFEQIECLETSNHDGREPFGFVDGISQPGIDWDQKRKVSINGYERNYSNVVCLGEFLLGYTNEYGRYTDRPLLDSRERGSSELPPADDHPGKADFGKNGTYLVMRQLAQDVRGFWNFLDKATDSNPAERDKLGSCMVGRRLSDGAPLVPLSSEAIAGVGDKGREAELNNFTYDSDVEGTRCPYGAHVRRANPRSPDVPGTPIGLVATLVRTLGFGRKNLRDDLIASTRFHRILRRGREYGPELSPDEALQPAPTNEAERGLYFLAINGNIQRQFEFVQNAWLMGTKFNGVTEESDPITGNRETVVGCPFTNTFSMPRNGAIRRRAADLPQFVFVRGGAYFFLPSLSALRYLSSLGD
jgi:deferrochelatase/peroxidase EfeB